MIAGSFDGLLTGSLSSRLAWESSTLCPCTTTEGAADRQCPVCRGQGRTYLAPSAPFRAGLVGLSAKQLEYQMNKFGPGLAGEAQLSLPSCAPCYGTLQPKDRIIALDALETREWTILPAVPLRLPSMAIILSARVRSGAQVVEVPRPVPAADGLVTVAVPTVIRFEAPRRYEVLPDAGQVRAFTSGMPRKHMLKLVDFSVR